MKLTEPQAWALEGIRQGRGASPAALGQWMIERPGIKQEYPGKARYKAQALGRMGGVMMERLRKKGLIRVTSHTSHGWCPSRASITDAGVDALRKHVENL